MARTVTTTSTTARTRTGIGKSTITRTGRTPSGGGGGVAPPPEKVSTTVKRLPDGSKVITTRDAATGQVISTTFKDAQGRTTTAPPVGVSSTGEVIEEKPIPSRRVGERFPTTEPGLTGFAGGRVSAIFVGRKAEGARRVFEPSVSQIVRPGKEPVKVTRLKEPSIGVVVSEREAEIRRRGGVGLTEQQLREAELIARREAPKVIALPPGEAERIQAFFKEFGLTKAEDVFKGVEKGTLDITKTEEGLKVVSRIPRVIVTEPREPTPEKDKQLFGVTQKIIEEGREFAAILKGEKKLKSLTPIGESIQETKLGRFLDIIGGVTGVAATTVAGGVSQFLEPPAFELFKRPPTLGVPETITLEELELKRERRREEFVGGTLTLGFLAAGLTDLRPFTFPVRELTKIEIRPGVKPKFPKPRIGDRAGIERGFQPRGEERGLIPSKDLQATLKEPARLSRADLFEEIQLEPRAEVRARLTEQLGRLIEPKQAEPPSIKPSFDIIEIAKQPEFTPLARDFLARRGQLFFEDISQPITRQPARLPPPETIQVKLPDLVRVPKGVSVPEPVIIETIAGKRAIIFGRKGQQSLIPGERVFERATSFFGLEPGEAFRPKPGVQVPGLEVARPTTRIGFVPLTLDISKRAVVARTGLESRVENLLELSAEIRLGQAQRVGQELTTLQRTRTLQRTAQKQLQEQMLGQVLEQELVTPKPVVTPRVTTKVDLIIPRPPRPSPPRPPGVPPPIPPPLMVEEKVRRQGFDVLVRESRPKGKSKRQFFKVNTESLPENKALNLGGDIVDNSSARTFKIVRSKKTTEARDDIMFNKSHKFRRPRGRTRLPSGSYVEETQHLIDTPGEKRGITAKGLVALRRKKKKAKNLVGNKEAFGTIRGLVGRGQSLRSIREMLK